MFKLGGSLLDLPDWPARVATQLATVERPVLIVGGGAAVDVVRDWDHRFQLGAAAAHHLAMQSLRQTASLAQRLLPRGRLCATVAEVASAWTDAMLPIIEPHAWFAPPSRWFAGSEQHSDPTLPGGCLPESWDVTSDALAAAVAIDLQAAELVLLKSVDWPEKCVLETASERGLVDAWLPQLAIRIDRVRWTNLRSGGSDLIDAKGTD